MTTVESKIVSIRRIDEDIFKSLSNFNNFSPYIQAAKLENWRSDTDWCRFDAQGVKDIGLRIVDREPFKTIKFTGEGNSPMEFFLWIQLKMVAPYDTRMKLTLKANMNFMVKMLLGTKLKEGLDAFADQIASALNG